MVQRCVRSNSACDAGQRAAQHETRTFDTISHDICCDQPGSRHAGGRHAGGKWWKGRT